MSKYETAKKLVRFQFRIWNEAYTYFTAYAADNECVMGRTNIKTARLRSSFEVDIWINNRWQRYTIFINRKHIHTEHGIIGVLL